MQNARARGSSWYINSTVYAYAHVYINALTDTVIGDRDAACCGFRWFSVATSVSLHRDQS